MNSKDSKEPRRVNRRHAFDKRQREAYQKQRPGANRALAAAKNYAQRTPE